jgi:hypothetical protein
VSRKRPGETEYELVQRRGREAEERARNFDAAVAARRVAGIPDKPIGTVLAAGGGTFDCNGNPKGSGWW